MKAFLKITLLELKLFLRDPSASFFTLGLPILLLLFFVGGNEPREVFLGLGAADFMVSGYVGLMLATAGLLGLANKLALDRENHILRRMRTTPLSPRSLMAAYVGSQLAITTIGMLVLLTSGYFVHGLNPPASPGLFLFAYALSAVSFFSLSFLLASVLPTAQGTQRATMLLYFPMIFFTGATAPRAILPESVEPLAALMPMTHAIELMQNAWAGGAATDMLPQVGILLGVLVLSTVISARTFRWE